MRSRVAVADQNGSTPPLACLVSVSSESATVLCWLRFVVLCGLLLLSAELSIASRRRRRRAMCLRITARGWWPNRTEGSTCLLEVKGCAVRLYEQSWLAADGDRRSSLFRWWEHEHGSGISCGSSSQDDEDVEPEQEGEEGSDALPQLVGGAGQRQHAPIQQDELQRTG